MSVAESLINLANQIEYPPGKLIIDVGMEEQPTPAEVQLGLSRIALALRLKRHPDIVFQAMMENWDLSTIIRKLH